MNIEMACPGCGRKLRVASDQAGKAARCPLCNTIYTVDDETSRSDSPSGSQRWLLKTPEGQTYGPISRELLDRWAAEGRVTDDCRLMCEPEGIWQPASDVYPVLRPIPKKVSVSPAFDNPVAGGFHSDGTNAEPGRVRIVNAHRGGLVLALGILSWAIGCPFFGVLAWIMGSSDLRGMQRGVIDPSGMGLTQAGQIIGMIHALLMLVVLVVIVFGMLVLEILS